MRAERLQKNISFARDKYRHASIYCTLLYCFTDAAFFFFFYRRMVCGDPTSRKSTGTILLVAFAHFVSLVTFW